MPIHDVLHDRQSKSCSAHFARPVSIDSVKPLGQPWQVTCRDADAGILDREHRRAIHCLPADSDVPAARRVSDRVEHQVGKGAVEFRFAALQAQVRLHIQFHVVLLFATEFARLVDNGIDQTSHRHRLGIHLRGLRLQPRQQHEILDDTLHASGLVLHAAQLIGVFLPEVL